MSVYVDDMAMHVGRMIFHHMMADTSDELHAMADAIGVNRKWCQYPGTPKEHYDIGKGKRALAVARGAKEITWRQMGALWKAKREAHRGTIDDDRL